MIKTIVVADFDTLHTLEILGADAVSEETFSLMVCDVYDDSIGDIVNAVKKTVRNYCQTPAGAKVLAEKGCICWKDVKKILPEYMQVGFKILSIEEVHAVFSYESIIAKE